MIRRRKFGLAFIDNGPAWPSITWPEPVEEALCFGWIDGIRKKIARWHGLGIPSIAAAGYWRLAAWWDNQREEGGNAAETIATADG